LSIGSWTLSGLIRFAALRASSSFLASRSGGLLPSAKDCIRGASKDFIVTIDLDELILAPGDIFSAHRSMGAAGPPFHASDERTKIGGVTIQSLKQTLIRRLCETMGLHLSEMTVVNDLLST